MDVRVGGWVDEWVGESLDLSDNDFILESFQRLW